MSDDIHVTDGNKEVTADELVNGNLYVMEQGDNDTGHLRQVARTDDDLPRVRITREALDAVRNVCRGMRKEMGGYRPEITMALSALVLEATSRPDATKIIAEYGLKQFQDALNNREGESGANEQKS